MWGLNVLQSYEIVCCATKYLPFCTSFLVVLFDEGPPLELELESAEELSAMKSLSEPAESDPSSCFWKIWSARGLIALIVIYIILILLGSNQQGIWVVPYSQQILVIREKAGSFSNFLVFPYLRAILQVLRVEFDLQLGESHLNHVFKLLLQMRLQHRVVKTLWNRKIILHLNILTSNWFTAWRVFDLRHYW